MLFGSNILEIALAMVFVYLLLSLLCSAVAEYIEAKLNYRAKDLEKGIRLLLDPQEKETPKTEAGTTPPTEDSQEQEKPGEAARPVVKGLADELYKHPLVTSLYRGERRPSYIPSRTFALALWDMAFPQDKRGAAADAHDLKTIRAAVRDNKFVNDEVKRAMLALIDDAGNDFNKARKNIEDWYDSAMDRVSGWYKRRVQYILLAIGLLTSALINVDTVNIAKALATNDALRKSVVAVAEKTAEEKAIAGISLVPEAIPPAATALKQTPAANSNSTANANSTVNAKSTAGASSTATPPAARTPAPANTNQSPTPTATPTPADPAERVSAAAKKVGDLRGQLDQLGLPVGWVRARYETKDGVPVMKDGRPVMSNASDPRRFPDDPSGWLLKVIGLVITALAVSQGAPFWFDLLNKIIVIRSTVKPREKSPTQPSKDMPAPETQQGKS